MATEGLQPQNSNITGIEWTIYPIKRNWKISAVLIFFLVILCVAIYFSFDSLTFLLLSAVILICSLSPFFFPTKYMLQGDRMLALIQVPGGFLREKIKQRLINGLDIRFVDGNAYQG